jgi:uncharacterized protein YjbI with pentapeptide repeats
MSNNNVNVSEFNNNSVEYPLSNAVISDGKISSPIFGATIYYCTFINVTFDCRITSTTSFEHCTFTDCNFVDGCSLKSVIFFECSFRSCSWSEVIKKEVSFNECKFVVNNFDKCVLCSVKFDYCRFDVCSLRSCEFDEIKFSSLECSSSVFLSSKFYECDFIGLDGIDFSCCRFKETIRGNGKTVISFIVDVYSVTMTSDVVNIGCTNLNIVGWEAHQPITDGQRAFAHKYRDMLTSIHKTHFG